MSLSVAETERFPIPGTFTISRGSKTEAEVIACTIRGRRELRPGRMRALSALRRDHGKRAAADRGWQRLRSRRHRPRRATAGHGTPGAARNAVDCALWDLEAKLSGIRVAEQLGIAAPTPLETAFTLSLGSPEIMAAQARENAARPLLKVKIGGDGDIERIRAVRDAAPKAGSSSMPTRAGPTRMSANITSPRPTLGVALVEQPLPAGKDAILGRHRPPGARSAPTRACTQPKASAALVGLYDAINIKLDKTGGLTAALAVAPACRRTRLQDHGRLHGRHVACHGAGRSSGAGCRLSSTSTGRCCWRATASPGFTFTRVAAGALRPNLSLWG